MHRIAFIAALAFVTTAASLPISHLTRAPQDPPAALPSVTLPAELDRVLRDYERNWKGGDEAALAALFTDDGFINRRGWIRGRASIQTAYANSGGDLRLRAVGYATGDTVGYIVGGYRYGAASNDGGMFVLALRRARGGPWKIAVDLDAANR